MTDNLVIMKKERSVLKTAVNKLIDKISDEIKSVDGNSFALEEMLDQLNDQFGELKTLDNEIKKLIPETQLDTELQNAVEFREKITTCRFRANRKIKELNAKLIPSEPSENKQTIVKESINLKLPKLQIEKFSGNRNEWLSFWSAFETSIHENESLDLVDKFNYLKSFLTGSALKSIEGFAITAENYPKAVDILKSRFGQKEILINVHMNNLLNISPLKHSGDAKTLRKIYDEIQTQIRSLESLDIPIETYGNLLCPILLKLLPRDMIIEFNKENLNQSYSVKEILSFLFKQLNSRERIVFEQDYVNKSYHSFKSRRPAPADDFPPHHENKQNRKTSPLPTATDLFIEARPMSEKEKCVFCDQFSHKSQNCDYARKLSFEDKKRLILSRGICYRCLRIAKHIARDCPVSTIICSICKGKHMEIMCNKKSFLQKRENNPSVKNDEKLNYSLANQNNFSNIYLQTLIARIEGKDSTEYVRILIDSGSMNSYVSKHIAKNMKLTEVKKEKIKHGLFGGVEMYEDHTRYKFIISSLDRKYNLEIEALDQEKICSELAAPKDIELLQSLENKGIFLTDAYRKSDFCLFENNPEEIHLLLGADVAGQLFKENTVNFPDLGLTAFETKLGWTIMGKREGVQDNNQGSLAVMSLSLHVSNFNLTDLWRLDTLGILDEGNKNKRELEEETHKYFLETVTKDNSGRYEVSLPWVVDNSVLQSNRSLAEKCLYQTEKKLINSGKRNEYEEIFKFWETNQIIESVPDNKSAKVHFLPHRPVIKENSETTKIRPVFNASAHSQGSPSLNDCLAKGPNMIEIVPRILNRFRKYKIGISSDIEKAFLQIKIREKDRDFLRFFWYDSEHNIKTFRHCRVVFGLTSSPFLLAATLDHLLNDVHEQFCETAYILKNSFYIDNSLTSLNSVPESIKFMQESKTILASSHFNLRCWRSNLPEILTTEIEDVPKCTSVLGLMWDLENDSLNCKIEEIPKIKEPITKRTILSITQKIFDPIGFTAPVTLIPKLILQETWVEKIKWDEELPQRLKKQFISWLKGIDVLSQIKVPRWLNIDAENEHMTTLHAFADASKQAYATCVYVRVETPEGVKIQLVNARSRVAPIKELTIPRLELLSCLIAARLVKTVETDLKLEKIRKFFWSDSTTALGWIRRDQAWGTFVHNRVSEIRTLTRSEDWRHLPGASNPADLPSRGCSFEQLKKSRWWEGPSWLYLPEDQWPHSEEEPDEQLLNKEKRKTVLNLLEKNEKTDWYYKYFSSYRKIVRMLAWIYRFFHNLKNQEKNLASNISVDEFIHAEKVLCKLIQKESFSGITDPTIKSLRPLEDDFGLLRVKSSIINRNDEENFKYPIILPSNHPVVHRLIIQTHIENQHAGVSILMALLRENFWILKSRKSIRNVIRKCIKCKRFEIPRTDVEPGIPPEDRVKEAAVFEVVGVDLAGPLYLSDRSKAWIVLYTCAVYRAIHLELVTSLSTETFLQSMRRFIARRGRPYVIYSDNGKNFVGANKALSSVDWKTISEAASTQKIRWRFNPPSAPWWGGWWERIIRMVKEALRKTLGRASLNYEELNTILCDCEQMINSRPITYVSEDYKDPYPLTPMMFLKELPSSGVPDLDALDHKSLSRRARYRQRILTDLKNRFRSEYLGQLRQHSLKKEIYKHLQVGDIVLLEEANKKRLHWPLGKITEVIPGKDSVVRLARVQTENGIFLRPVQRLYPLEISTAEDRRPRTSDNAQLEPKDPPNLDDNTSQPITVTRAGRVVKPPERLHL